MSYTDRTIARHMRAAGYSAEQVRYGIAFADSIGYSTAREGYILAMSRVLYGDDDLQDGARFAVEQGYGPRT